MPDKKKRWAYRLAEQLRLSDYPLGAATNQMIADELDRAVSAGEITQKEYDEYLKRGLKQGFIDAVSVGTGALAAAATPYYAGRAAHLSGWADHVARNTMGYTPRSLAAVAAAPSEARLMTAAGRAAYTASAGAPLAATATQGQYQMRGASDGNYFSYPAERIPNGYQRLGYIDPLQENPDIMGRVAAGAPAASAPAAGGLVPVGGYAVSGSYPAGTFMQRSSTASDPQGNATGAASSSSSKAATAPRKGETVASYWTRVTGLPWKAAREMGLSDGSYASNIEIYKGLKNGSITKESLAAMSEAQNAVPYEPAPETYAMPARPVIERQRLPFDEPADMTPPSEREMQMAAYGGYLPLIGFAPAAYACGGKMKRR